MLLDVVFSSVDKVDNVDLVDTKDWLSNLAVVSLIAEINVEVDVSNLISDEL